MTPSPGTGRRWPLRRRLVAVVLGLVLLVGVVTGVVSTVALRGSLLAQVDERTVAAAQRAVRATQASPFPDDPADGRGEDTAPGADDGRVEGGRERGRRGERPPSLDAPGQDVGTVSLVVGDGTTRAQYLDTDASFVDLTEAQVDALLDVPADGRVHPVTLDGLGPHRAVALRTDDGELVVTALPSAGVEATVRRYVAVEVLAAAGALLVAGVGGSLLVRRELEPLTRMAATATRVAEQPLGRGEVAITARVDERDTDPSTEVGQVGAALNRMLGHVERALAERQESEQQVRRFVADASHELRTPLASIRGYTELVRRSPEELPADARAALARVESEATRMSALVDDLLLLARLDAGRPLERAPVDLAALAVDAVADAHVAGPEHVWRLDLPGQGDESVQGDPDVPDDEVGTLTVLGDDHRLRQVLGNLTSNARRHTPAGTHVTVAVRRDGDDVVVSVTDDGPGVPPELRDRLFERFARGDESRNRAAGSTGLGLAIARAVVTAHGGTLTCESAPGRTSFVVRVPAADVGR
ncbi:HAMP domain-containing histidine kinase [Cellulomonas sp. zg-ZUI199]|uniref:histidine kinase n=1 Tax=Cellulomonas wangleii TaxID=2816956 RepID=A0ABX8D637_9CELL|nr:HAMP domain-containing sensor histidine kinase [Cellulomonas wangleii]MBO0924742.1 HAMP domain-containing histidine kinase [Cellulomonas wangleii]QVI62924.1 HAMP domain-containing histidine kinase [Cellulomonas wangleii]